jgi:xylan 1,4-beta-xylosidase
MPLPHFWEHTVGSDQAPIALRADWQAQLRRCHDDLGFRHVRFHGLLSDDMGTLICHKERFLSSFFNADQIWDFLLSIGMRPFVELSFMPSTLASGDTTVFRYRGNVTPPKDHQQWRTLIHRLASHWVDRYGVPEVGGWLFEVWNEPNLAAFWTGTQAEYFELYRHAAMAIKEVDGRLRVGGPSSARNEWIPEFLDFCDRNALPADFVTTHHYPTDALGHEDQDTETQLANSRRSILQEWAQSTHRQARGRPVYYTEWNTSSNPRDPRHDEPYAAAFVAKTVMEAAGLVEGYSFWTFTDIFAENYYPSVPFHGGFGLLTLHGIPKPTYRAYELLHRLGTERLEVEGHHETVDAWVVRGETAVTVLLTNFALPRHPISTERVHVSLVGAPALRTVFVTRIDEQHANAKRIWQEMGQPKYLRPRAVERLHDASRLRDEDCPWTRDADSLHLHVELPPHSVAAVTVECDRRAR